LDGTDESGDNWALSGGRGKFKSNIYKTNDMAESKQSAAEMQITQVVRKCRGKCEKDLYVLPADVAEDRPAIDVSQHGQPDYELQPDLAEKGLKDERNYLIGPPSSLIRASEEVRLELE